MLLRSAGDGVAEQGVASGNKPCYGAFNGLGVWVMSDDSIVGQYFSCVGPGQGYAKLELFIPEGYIAEDIADLREWLVLIDRRLSRIQKRKRGKSQEAVE